MTGRGDAAGEGRRGGGGGRGDPAERRKGGGQGARRSGDTGGRGRSQPRAGGGATRREGGGQPGRRSSAAARRKPSGDGQRRNRSAAEALSRGSVALPRWVRDALVRVTPKSRVAGALRALEEAAGAFVQGRYRRALARAETAKSLSPRDATIRELIGLSAYRLGRWEQALQELRNYRRLAGDTTHLPVEMDALRALKRPDDVEATWVTLTELGGSPPTMKEGRVVYGSFLLDTGRHREAWDVVKPKRIVSDPFEEDLRQWFVAARAAAALGDGETAARLRDAITTNDPGFPGLEDLDSLIGG